MPKKETASAVFFEKKGRINQQRQLRAIPPSIISQLYNILWMSDDLTSLRILSTLYRNQGWRTMRLEIGR